MEKEKKVRGSSRSETRARTGVQSRDIEVLRLIAEQYALRIDQLARILGKTGRSARRWRVRFESLGLIEAKQVFADEPAYLWLTPEGQRQCGTVFKRWKPRVGLLSHIVAVVDVRIYVTQAEPSVIWVSERELHRAIDDYEHCPDAAIYLPDGSKIAVEVELTRKSKERTLAIVEQLQFQYELIRYFAPASVKAFLEKLIDSHALERVEVLDLPGQAHVKPTPPVLLR